MAKKNSSTTPRQGPSNASTEPSHENELNRPDKSLFAAWGDAEDTEDDLSPLTPEKLREAVVSSTDWTTETIIRLFERGTIELDPAFQRRDAWTPARKSAFIESLVMGLPIPQIVLAERRDKRGHFIVLDGKQRLLTLRQFAGSESESEPSRLKLSGLRTLSNMNGYTYDELSQNSQFGDDLEAFRNQPIRAVVIKNWPSEDFLYLVFLRLNTGSVPLAPQELRQALHPGPFVSFVNERSAASNALQEALRIRKPDFRMRDVELLVRFFAFQLFFKSYSGNMKQFLDRCCEDLNARWDDSEKEIRSLADKLDSAIQLAQLVFPSKSLFSIFKEGEWETRFNRAVFDIFCYALTNGDVAKKLATKPAQEKVLQAYKSLCEKDDNFLDALQTTTKSLQSVHCRFSTFTTEVNRILKTKIPVPYLDDAGKIKFK